MAALRAVVIIVAAMAALSHAATATMYTVGAPDGGWDMNTDLQTWASNLNFTVGDSLVFRYASNHDVVEVVKAEYDACTATKPIQSFTGGNTLVFLPVSGKKYFICSVSGHCAAGMKLEVDVASGSGTSGPPPQPPLSSPAPSPMAPPPMTPEGLPSPSESTLMASPPSTSDSPMSSPPSISPTVAPTPQLESAAPASAPNFVTAPPPTPKSSDAHGCCGTPAKAIGFMVGVLMVLAL